MLARHGDLSGAFQRLVRGRISGFEAQGVPAKLAFLQQEQPISSSSVKIDRPDELIGFVQMRKHMSQYILFDYAVLLNEYSLITEQLDFMDE